MARKLFKKGESGNPNGRPKGSKNRTTEELRMMLKQIIDDNLDDLYDDIRKMKPIPRAMILEKLIKYNIPALTKNDNLNNNSGEIKITVEYTDTPAANGEKKEE